MKTKKLHFKVRPKLILYLFGGTVLMVIMIINIAASQSIPELYFRFINEDRNSIITYLLNIKNLPSFTTEFLRYKNTYGSWVERGVYKAEEDRNKNIARFESALQKNPLSRDILYELALLYKEKGDDTKSQYYLQKARTIDPTIK